MNSNNHNSNLVSVQNIYMSFPKGNGDKEIEVLNNLTMNVKKGEVISILGPSGCGKTTLIKLIGGLLLSKKGLISVDGLEPAEARNRRTFSFMFQNPVLLPWLTVHDNVKLPGQVFGDKEIIERASYFIKLVGLSGFEDLYPDQLSGGMKSRVALARALSFKPKLLLMDEPFGALDALTRSIMQNELLSILNTSPTTVILVTHSISEAVYVSDRVILLSNRPANIILDLPVELPVPREQSIQEKTEFLLYQKKIKEILFERQLSEFFRINN